MALPKMPAFSVNFSDLPDKLQDSPAVNKAKFDSRGNEIKDFIDNTLTPAIEEDLATKETPTGAQTKADIAESNAKAYADQQKADLAGAGRTTETVKGNADALSAHLADVTSIMIFSKSVNQSIPNNIQTDVIFDTTEKVGSTTENFAEISNGKIRILKSGMYLLTLNCRLQIPATNTGFWRVATSDANQLIPLITGTANYMKLSSLTSFTANSEVPINVRQNNGGSLNLEVANVRLMKLGDIQ